MRMRLTVEAVDAAGRNVHASENVHKGRFARPGGVGDCNKFDRFNLTTDPLQGLKKEVTDFETATYVV